jgi:hypothetical protein
MSVVSVRRPASTRVARLPPSLLPSHPRHDDLSHATSSSILAYRWAIARTRLENALRVRLYNLHNTQKPPHERKLRTSVAE